MAYLCALRLLLEVEEVMAVVVEDIEEETIEVEAVVIEKEEIQEKLPAKKSKSSRQKKGQGDSGKASSKQKASHPDERKSKGKKKVEDLVLRLQQQRQYLKPIRLLCWTNLQEQAVPSYHTGGWNLSKLANSCEEIATFVV